MLEKIFGERVFGAKVALGMMGAAVLMAVAREGFVVGQWLGGR